MASEKENAKLLIDLEKEVKEVSRLKDVDADLEKLKGELDDMQVKLKETSLELGKTQAKNRSLEKHEKVRSGLNGELYMSQTQFP